MAGLRIRFRLGTALIAGALAAVLGVALSACGGDNGFSLFSDAGAQPDFASPADMGLAQPSVDLGSQGGIVLAHPEPLSSGVALDAHFELYAAISDAPDRLESDITVTPRGLTTPLAGAFSWNSGANGYQLTFIPSAPLTDATDFVISVADPQSPSGPPLLHTGISTGSHPRVTRVTLQGPGSGAGATLAFTFSEPMAEKSVLASATVTAGGQPVSGTLASDPKDTLGRAFVFTVGPGHALPSPIVLHIAAGAMGAQAATGTALDPASWDSPTAAPDGSFQVTFTGLDFAAQAPIDTFWAPTID